MKLWAEKIIGYGEEFPEQRDFYGQFDGPIVSRKKIRDLQIG